MRSALLLVALVLVGCGQPRSWYIPEKERPTFAVDGLGAIEFAQIKQRDDYLRVVLTLRNDSDEAVRFAPITDATTAWGVQLVADVGDRTVCRTAGIAEPVTFIPPHGRADLECHWLLSSPMESNDWQWAIDIHGLMVGGKECPTVFIAMPTFRQINESSRR